MSLLESLEYKGITIPETCDPEGCVAMVKAIKRIVAEELRREKKQRNDSKKRCGMCGPCRNPGNYCHDCADTLEGMRGSWMNMIAARRKAGMSFSAMQEEVIERFMRRKRANILSMKDAAPYEDQLRTLVDRPERRHKRRELYGRAAERIHFSIGGHGHFKIFINGRRLYKLTTDPMMPVLRRMNDQAKSLQPFETESLWQR